MTDYAKGLDCSHHQGVIDWPKVSASGISFGYAKATQGVGFIDTRFAANFAGMRGAGILCGAYHYFSPMDDALAQADIFLSAVAPKQGDLWKGNLPPALDVEAHDGLNKRAIVRGLRIWLAVVEQALGVKPVLYTSASFWNANVASDLFAGYPLWVPHYTTQPAPNLPAPWTDWQVWQHSDQGMVVGITGPVDLDRARPEWLAGFA